MGEDRNELYVGNIPISTLVARYGSPVYIYDRSVLDRQLGALRAALPERFCLYYSMKANPHQAFLTYFRERGCGVEIASGGEFYQALRAGFCANDIVFAGPGKTSPELELALTHGIGEIHVESQREIERIAALSRTHKVHTRIALRVNPAGEAESGAMSMGGRAAPFGIDEEHLDAAIDHVLAQPELELSGLHLFMATQILDHRVLLHHYQTAIELARRLAQRLGHPLRTLDLGAAWEYRILPMSRP